MNINDFLANISQSGVAFQSDYEMQIINPFGDFDAERDMVMRCASVDFPGRSINYTEVSYYGKPFRLPVSSLSGILDVSIILSEDLREKEYLETWFDNIVGNYRNETNGNMFDINFYDNIVGRINIRKLDPTGAVTYETTLLDVYPINIGNLNMNWSSGNIMILHASFSYRYYGNPNRSEDDI